MSQKVVFYGVFCVLFAISAAGCGKDKPDTESGIVGESSPLVILNGREMSTGEYYGSPSNKSCAVSVEASAGLKRISLRGKSTNLSSACGHELGQASALTFDCADDGKCSNPNTYGVVGSATSYTYSLIIVNSNSVTVLETEKYAPTGGAEPTIRTREIHFR